MTTPVIFPSPLSGNETLRAFSKSPNGRPTGQDFLVTSAQIAALAATLQTSPTNTNITTVGNGTITAASLVGLLATRSGPTSGFTDTTDTAANIISAMPSAAVIGDAFVVYYANTTAFPATLAAGSGVSFVGAYTSPVIPANSTAELVITYSATGAMTIRVVESTYNNAGGYDPSSILTQFGSGTGTFGEEGNIYKSFPAAGTSPASTGGDIVVATYTIPANSFDVAGRSLSFYAMGNFAANANTKTAKIIFGATTATVGSAVVGGTTIATTGASTGSGVGWALSSNVNATGANTQSYQETSTIVGTTHGGMGVSAALALTASSPIICAVTINCATTATDASLWAFEINATN